MDLQSSLLLKLIDQVTQPAKQAAQALSGLREGIDKLNTRGAAAEQRDFGRAVRTVNTELRNLAGGFAAVYAGYQAMKRVIAEPVIAAANVQELLHDLRDSLQTPIGDEAFTALVADLDRLRAGLPGTRADWIRMRTEAERFHVPAEEMGAFLQYAAKMGLVFDTSAESFIRSFRGLQNQLRLTTADTQAVIDKMVAVSETTGAVRNELLETVRSVGGEAAAIGLHTDEVLALATALYNTGANAGEVETALHQTFLALGAGTNATKDQEEAFRALGTTGRAFAADLRTNPIAAITELIRRLNDPSLDPQARAEVERRLFGTRNRYIEQLIANEGLWREAVALMNNTLATQGAAVADYTERQGDANMAFRQFAAAFEDLKEAIGQTLLPDVTALVQGLTQVLGVMHELALQFPGLTKALGMFVAAVAGFGIVMGSFAILRSLASLAASLLGVAGAGAAAAASFAGFAAGVAAIGVVVWSAVRDWDLWSAKFEAVGEAITGAAAKVREDIAAGDWSAAWAHIGDGLVDVKDAVAAALRQIDKSVNDTILAITGIDLAALVERGHEALAAFAAAGLDAGRALVANILAGIRDAVYDLIAFFRQLGAELVDSLVAGLESKFTDVRNALRAKVGAPPVNTPVDKLTGSLDSYIRQLGLPPGALGDAAGAAKPIGRAMGGPVLAGRPYWVVERGEPEIFMPREPGQPILFTPERSGWITPLSRFPSPIFDAFGEFGGTGAGVGAGLGGGRGGLGGGYTGGGANAGGLRGGSYGGSSGGADEWAAFDSGWGPESGGRVPNEIGGPDERARRIASRLASGGADLKHLSPAARAMLQGVLNAGVVPTVRVTSGYRSPEHNRRVRGAKNSQHIHGNAIDFDVSGMSDAEKAALLSAAIASGGKGVGIYASGNSLHVDTRRAPMLWGATGFDKNAISDAPRWARPILQDLFAGRTPRVSGPASSGPGGGVASAAHIMDKLISLGWSPEDAAAAAGVAFGENHSMRPDVRNSLGAAGLFQMLSKDRQAGLAEYARRTGRDWRDPDVQLEWYNLERTGGSVAYGGSNEKAAFDAALAASSVREKAYGLAARVQRPGAAALAGDFGQKWVPGAAERAYAAYRARAAAKAPAAAPAAAAAPRPAVHFSPTNNYHISGANPADVQRAIEAASRKQREEFEAASRGMYADSAM